MAPIFTRPQLLVAFFAPLGCATRIALSLLETRLVGQSASLAALGSGFFFANIAGCVTMSFLLRFRSHITSIDTALYVGLGTGFCGCLTTFSTWSQRASWLIVQGYVFDGFMVLTLMHTCAWVSINCANTMVWAPTKKYDPRKDRIGVGTGRKLSIDGRSGGGRGSGTGARDTRAMTMPTLKWGAPPSAKGFAASKRPATEGQLIRALEASPLGGEASRNRRAKSEPRLPSSVSASLVAEPRLRKRAGSTGAPKSKVLTCRLESKKYPLAAGDLSTMALPPPPPVGRSQSLKPPQPEYGVEMVSMGNRAPVSEIGARRTTLSGALAITVPFDYFLWSSRRPDVFENNIFRRNLRERVCLPPKQDTGF